MSKALMLEKDGYRTEKNQCQKCLRFVWDRGVVQGCTYKAVGVQEVKQKQELGKAPEPCDVGGG